MTACGCGWAVPVGSHESTENKNQTRVFIPIKENVTFEFLKLCIMFFSSYEPTLQGVHPYRGPLLLNWYRKHKNETECRRTNLEAFFKSHSGNLRDWLTLWSGEVGERWQFEAQNCCFLKSLQTGIKSSVMLCSAALYRIQTCWGLNMVLRCWRCGVKAKCFLSFFPTRETASKTETSEIFVCVCLTYKISHQINSTKQSLVFKDYARLWPEGFS